MSRGKAESMSKFEHWDGMRRVTIVHINMLIYVVKDKDLIESTLGNVAGAERYHDSRLRPDCINGRFGVLSKQT